MSCDGKCIPMNFGVPDPTGKEREQVVTTRTMTKFGDRWSAGTHHWRCAECLASRADATKVPATAAREQRPVEVKPPKVRSGWTLEDLLGRS